VCAGGEVRQEYEVTLLGRPVGGQPTVNIEASDLRWVALSDLDTLDAHPTMRRQIDRYLTGLISACRFAERQPREAFPRRIAALC
jgi:hypothetical protein